MICNNCEFDEKSELMKAKYIKNYPRKVWFHISCDGSELWACPDCGNVQHNVRSYEAVNDD